MTAEIIDFNFEGTAAITEDDAAWLANTVIPMFEELIKGLDACEVAWMGQHNAMVERLSRGCVGLLLGIVGVDMLNGPSTEDVETFRKAPQHYVRGVCHHVSGKILEILNKREDHEFTDAMANQLAFQLEKNGDIADVVNGRMV